MKTVLIEGLEAIEEEGLAHGETTKIIRFKEVGSTNDIAVSLAEKGHPHGTIVIAESQSKGKGRLGRRWHSPPGSNIFMSIILRPELPPYDVTIMTFLSAVSCARAIRKETGVDVRIKWPNDLMASGRKMGGILLESKSERGRIIFFVVGIGINVNMKEEDFPQDLKAIATSVFIESGKICEKGPIIEGITDEMFFWLDVLKKGDRAAIFKNWKALSDTLGQDVNVLTPNGLIIGRAVTVDEKGRLILKTKKGELKIISAGDVMVLRKEAPGRTSKGLLKTI